MKPTVFVSHIHEDAETATRLKEWIEERLLGAVEVFVSSDGSSIRGGDRWMETIETALRASKLVVVLCTPSSTQRRWVFFEAGGAFFLGARVIPVCSNGLVREQLEAPLSFLQAFHLADASHLKQLLGEIASHAGLRAPSSDLSTDAEWLATGARTAATAVLRRTADSQYTPVSLKEAAELAAQVPRSIKVAAERALLMFEYSYFQERGQGFAELEKCGGWATHFLTKLQAAELALPARSDTAGTKRRASLQEIASHLKDLAAQENWTKEYGLLDLEPLLPESVPLAVRDLLILDNLEMRSSLGWQIQLDLIGRLAVHDDPLIPRVIGTLGRRDEFSTLNSFVNGLLKYARQILTDEADFERWFFEFARLKFEDFQARSLEDLRKLNER